MQPLVSALSWLGAHWSLLCQVGAVLLAIPRLVPAAQWAKLERSWPRLVALVRFLRAILPDVWKAAKQLYPLLTGRAWPLPDAAPGDRPTVVPPLPVLLFALVLGACSGSQARQQALVATGFGEASARALPVLVESYRQAQLRALPQCPSAARQGSQCPAVLAVRQQWAPLWTAWEGARLAHDRWSRVLMLCQSDPSAAECSQVLPAAEAAAFDAIQGARCTALALGERDLLSSLPLSCAADGGSNG